MHLQRIIHRDLKPENILINIETLHCECLFNSVDMIENVPSYHTLIELNRQYPEEFLQGRYRQDVVVFNKKIIVFGGGSFISLKDLFQIFLIIYIYI